MTNKTKEFGGFLPIELHRGNEYFSNYTFRTYNCANAAIEKILEGKSYNKILAPRYLCPNVCTQLASHNIPVEYYCLNEELLPRDLTDFDKSGNVFYFIDYFGVMDKKSVDFILGIKNATVIVDFCHSFFCKPIIRDNVFNLYSARKFFGVPDGAYLVAKTIDLEEYENEFCSSDYSSYLLESFEHGTNYCYSKKKEADSIIAGNHGSMSSLAKAIMQGADYEFAASQRKINARLFNNAFGKINRISFESGSIPYVYPLNFGKNIKKELISEKIYVPTLWAQTLTEEFKGTLEYSLSDETLFLPVDQRYNEEDIRYMIKIIEKYI